ncbi:MAG: GntR family transcriptional regulator [Treponema sp.]|jgi:DNA-binding GntR family transcriptional regulator|nr:GntR family transcriptional regulator [Treponema sp.]
MISLKLYAYNAIKEKIIHCQYPPNALLNEEIIKQDLHVSRTPIRDALGRLEQESIIKILPKRGILVTGITSRDVNQIFETRLLIEPYMMNKYGKTISPGVYREFLDFFSIDTDAVYTDKDKVNQKDNDFHLLFITASNNPYLIQANEYPFFQDMRLRILSASMGGDRISTSQKEHLAIARWCCEKDWKNAAKALKEHLVFSRKRALDVVGSLKRTPILLSAV